MARKKKEFSTDEIGDDRDFHKLHDAEVKRILKKLNKKLHRKNGKKGKRTSNKRRKR